MMYLLNIILIIVILIPSWLGIAVFLICTKNLSWMNSREKQLILLASSILAIIYFFFQNNNPHFQSDDKVALILICSFLFDALIMPISAVIYCIHRWQRKSAKVALAILIALTLICALGAYLMTGRYYNGLLAQYPIFAWAYVNNPDTSTAHLEEIYNMYAGDSENILHLETAIAQHKNASCTVVLGYARNLEKEAEKEKINNQKLQIQNPNKSYGVISNVFLRILEKSENYKRCTSQNQK